MGRELKRVALDFDWPLNKPWKGFVNPLYTVTQCMACEGSGYSPEAKELRDLWYGYIPFRPEDRGSVPFQPTDEHIVTFAARNVTHSPNFYGGANERNIQREAMRLCQLWNGSWCHHLNIDDVAALVETGRLMDFTHTFDVEKRWQIKDPPYVPTPREVNVWSCVGFGHDCVNPWICVKAECKRLGVPDTCAVCNGEGEYWPSPEAKKAYEDWQSYEPPAGAGYQIWETVSEGSPISPVFETARDLAAHMAMTKWGADKGTPFETWMKFIEGPGWAPSGISTPETGFVDGVTGAVALYQGPRA
jgi:hypothetical protein